MTTVRVATPTDRVVVRRLIDGAALSLAEVSLPERLAAGDVLLATRETRPQGTLVTTPRAESTHVVAIAVRRRVRDQGIGSTLVTTAARRWGTMTATATEDVLPFWRANDFEVTDKTGEYYQLRRGG